MTNHDDARALLSELFPQPDSRAAVQPEVQPSEGNRVPTEGKTPSVITGRPTTWGDFLDDFF